MPNPKQLVFPFANGCTRSTPPAGVPAHQLELSDYARRRAGARSPLVDGFSTAKRVPLDFFHPAGRVTIDKIADELTKYGKCGARDLYRAYQLLKKSHRSHVDPETGQRLVRDDGSDYLQHALRVAYRIALVGRGRAEDLQQTIAAGLHDVVEDFGVRLELIEDLFGKNVRDMVFWLTKPKWDKDSRVWVYPDSENYYTLKDGYVHSMYDSRGDSYYDRLYYISGNTSAWVIKAADNLDNLHTLRNVDPEKRRRNTRLIVRNTLAVLSRMLAREDTERLQRYIEGELGFTVPEDAIAPFAGSWVVSCESRKDLVMKGLEGVTAPRFGQINIYGAGPGGLPPSFEIGLPDDGRDYGMLLKEEFDGLFRILPEESYLPPGLAASEKIFRVEVSRDVFFRTERNFAGVTELLTDFHRKHMAEHTQQTR